MYPVSYDIAFRENPNLELLFRRSYQCPERLQLTAPLAFRVPVLSHRLQVS